MVDDICQPRINFFHVNVMCSQSVISIRFVRYLRKLSALMRKLSQVLQIGEQEDDLTFP